MQVRIKLFSHFTIASLIAFACVASAMVYFQARESARAESALQATSHAFGELQADLAGRAAAAVQHDVLTTRQDSIVELAQMLSAALWHEALSPLLAAAQKVDVTACSGPHQLEGTTDTASPQACRRRQMAQIQTMPAHATLDTRFQHALRDSLITSIRIHDLQGTTLYSTDRTRLGKDSSDIPGWQRAASGLPSSELLKQAADGRDVVTSHVPITDPRTRKTVAVFEVRSDATAHLQRARQTTADIRSAAALDQARVEQQSLDHRRQAQRSEQVQLMTLVGLLVLLFALLYSSIRRAHRAIEQQVQEIDADKQRLAQSETLTSLENIVASVAQQLNTPLAFSRSNVFMAIQSLKDMGPGIRSAAHVLDRVTGSANNTAAPRQQDLDTQSVRTQLSRCHDELSMTQDMLADVLTGLTQMNEMVDNLRSFTPLDRSHTAEVDLNSTLSSVIYIARAAISTKVQLVQKFSTLPRLECQVSRLNQVFLNLIMNAAQAIDGAGVVTVSTTTHGEHIRITVEDTGSGIPDDALPRIFDPRFTTRPTGAGLGLSLAREIVAEHGGTLSVTTQVGIGTTVQIEFPLPAGPSE